MHFLFSATDKAKSLDIRMQKRPEHVEFLKESQQHGVKILIAGPKLDYEGAMCGSTLIMEADSTSIVEEWLSKDPYAQAGLFSKSTLEIMKVVIGA